jgi:hypothetical protein
MKQAGPARASSVVVRLRLLAAAGMGACIVVAGWEMPEVRLARGAAAAVPLVQTHVGAGTVSPPEPARRLAEEAQAQPAAELPLKEESHPPPIVNYVPPKPKRNVDDKSRKTNTKTKSDTKSTAKKAAPSKTKSVRTKRKTK